MVGTLEFERYLISKCQGNKNGLYAPLNGKEVTFLVLDFNRAGQV